MDLSHIGLSEAPFGLRSDSRFVFESRAFKEALGELEAAIERRDTLIVLTGENGSGKTTICRALLERLDSSTHVSVIASPFLSLGDVLGQVLADFDTDSIATFLHRLPEDARALVVVDEAQDIDLRVLERLGTFRGLQVLIIGRPELMTRLSDSELRRPLDGRRVQWLKVSKIDADEVGSYIAWRIAAATHTAAPSVVFSRDGVKAVASISGGVPRVINRLCASALEIAGSRGVRTVDSSVVRDAARHLEIRRAAPGRRKTLQRTAIIAATVAVVVGEVLLWRRQGPTETPPAARAERAAPVAASLAQEPTTAPQSPDATTTTLPIVPGVLVSVATIDDPRRAQALVQELSGRGMPAFSQAVASSDARQVWIGPYVSREEAAEVQRQLVPLNYPAAAIVTVQP